MGQGDHYMRKYDKNKANEIHNQGYKIAWNSQRKLTFSSTIQNDGNTLGRLYEIAVVVKEGEEVSKAVILDRSIDPGNVHYARGYFSSYFTFLRNNNILRYSKKTLKWSRGDMYAKYFNDIDKCIAKKYKISLLEK